MATYKMVWLYSLTGGQTAMNVWYMQANTSTVAGWWATYVTWIKTVAWEILDDLIATTASLVQIEVYRLINGEWVFDQTLMINEIGQNANQQLPPTVSLLTHQGAGGGSRKGSKFIPGLTEHDWTGTVWSANVIARGASFLTQMCVARTIAANVAFTPGLMRMDEPSSTGSFYPYDGTFSIDLEPGTQRRRRKGVGV